MRLIPIATAAAAAAAALRGASARHLDNPVRDDAALRHQRLARATAAAAGPIVIDDDDLCLDVVDNTLRNNQAVQAWSCHGGTNQQWRAEGGKIKTADGRFCLDVPSGSRSNGVRLQIYSCVPGNTNQLFDLRQGSIVWRNTGKCLDLTDGVFCDGTPIQMWDCFAGSENQAMELEMAGVVATQVGAAVPRPASTTAPSPRTTTATPAATPTRAPSGTGVGAGTFLGWPYVGLDAFLRTNPVMGRFEQDMIDAAASVNAGLPPVLLGAIAMEESTGNPDVPYGLAQFTNAQTWAKYGQGTNINNGRDSLFAMARYLKDLLQAHPGDLGGALREYNGNSNGAYTDEVWTWLQGRVPASYSRRSLSRLAREARGAAAQLGTQLRRQLRA
jgi:hypothetical protein